jgi:polyisoprenoid-binding protein YceI
MHAPAASKENVPPSDLTRVINHQPVPAAGTYQIDPAHTFADFTAQHLVIGHVRGRFTQLTGQITVAEDLTQSAASVTIAAASIDTHVAKRDGDLRSARYLDVTTYPAITFASTRLTGYPGNQWGLAGDLTIKNITRPVELMTQFTGAAIDNNSGNAKVAFLAQARISRHDFGLTHELGNEAGSLLVRRDVTLSFAVEAMRTSTDPH